MSYEVHVLENGYSQSSSGGNMRANCTCTLIKGRNNLIIDTMTPWDKDKIISGLKRFNLECSDISYMVCTHGHSDHIGNNNLFLDALHIVGFDISQRDIYYSNTFHEGEAYVIDNDLKIMPTVGHSHNDVSVLVRTVSNGLVAITGDLFEREEDIADSSLWKDAGSKEPIQQLRNRDRLLLIVDWIVPGHGPMFKVTAEMRQAAEQRVLETS